MTQSDEVIRQLSINYEISLAVAKGNTVAEACDHVVTTILSRMNLDGAVVWIRDSSGTKSLRPELVYPRPLGEVPHIDQSTVLGLLKGRPSIELRPDQIEQILPASIETAGLFRLRDVGLLALIGNTTTNLARDRLRPLEGVIDLFAAAVQGHLALERANHELAGRRRAEERLATAVIAAEDANEAKSRFLSRVSHELRTPLHTVLGFAELLEMDLDGADRKHQIGTIRSAGTHLINVLDDVLDISLVEAGELELSMESVDLAATAAEATLMMAPRARVLGITLDNDQAGNNDDDLDQSSIESEGAEAGNVRVEADPARCRQILLNLVSNAVKYNSPGGSVTVQTTVRGNEVVASVADTGPGISDEDIARLFVPFDRLGRESSDIEGTGIGLMLASTLARAMGGRIEVVSSVGEGSTFSLVLPLAPAPVVASVRDS